MEVLKKIFTAFSRYARFAVIFHFQLNIQGRKLFKCCWFDKLASHFLAGHTFSHHHLSPPERGRGRGCVQESRNRLQKKMCEQLLFLPVLLAVTFKCQDSSCPIRKDQSSHVEKSQYWLQFLTGLQRTSLLMPALEPPDTSQPTGGQWQDSSVRTLWGQGPSTTTGRSVQGLETLTLRALPQRTFSGRQNKTPKPVPSHICLCSVARDEEGECHFWNAEHISFQVPHSFAHTILIWVSAPGSHFYNPVLKYFQSSHFCTPSTQAELDALATSCAEQTGGFYTPVSSLQNRKRNSMEVTVAYCVPHKI